MSTVTANIRAEMARRQVTQQDIADHLKLSPAAISARMSGQTKISVEELVDIARYLGVQPAELLAGAA